jgi:hypothetical protein
MSFCRWCRTRTIRFTSADKYRAATVSVAQAFLPVLILILSQLFRERFLPGSPILSRLTKQIQNGRYWENQF